MCQHYAHLKDKEKRKDLNWATWYYILQFVIAIYMYFAGVLFSQIFRVSDKVIDEHL